MSPRCSYCGFYMAVEHRHDGAERRRWCPNDKCSGNVGVFGDGPRKPAKPIKEPTP